MARWSAADPINNEWYNIAEGHNERNYERHFTGLTASDFEYCYGNPVRFIDPTGEQADPPKVSPGFPGGKEGSTQNTKEYVFAAPKIEKKPGFFKSLLNNVEHIAEKVWNKVEKVGKKIAHVATNVANFVAEVVAQIGTGLGFALNAVITNLAFGMGRADPKSAGKRSTAARIGQAIGDILSLVVGVAEIGAGLIGAAGGALISLGGVTVGIGAMGVAGGLAVAGHGALVLGGTIRRMSKHGLSILLTICQELKVNSKR